MSFFILTVDIISYVSLKRAVKLEKFLEWESDSMVLQNGQKFENNMKTNAYTTIDYLNQTIKEKDVFSY